MDYDTLALNLPVAGGTAPSAIKVEPEPQMCGGQDLLETKSKDKARRYWTPREEEHLYEIWGRDNWRLTRNGKNTVFFGLWAEELRDRFDVDVKPEEIQTKVNQTRAKFRQVRKSLRNDSTGNTARWKKFDIIDRILKNLYRPKDAEPLPPEALKNNRDVSPEPTDTPTEQVLNLTTEAVNNFYNNSSNSNNSSSHANANSGVGYNTELFTDQYDDVKQEYDEDYRSMPFQEQMQQYSPPEPAQLLELQTPQQQAQQQQQQQHLQQQQQQQQQQQHQSQFQPAYDQSASGYTAPVHYNATSNNVVGSTAAAPTGHHQAITAVAYINNSNNTISVAAGSNGQPTSMHPPLGVNAVNATGATSTAPTPTPRKRGRPYNAAASFGVDSLEAIFIEEVKRKNQLLAEQTVISRKMLQLEERKLELMASFFPKCLDQQNQILTGLLTSQSQPDQEQKP